MAAKRPPNPAYQAMLEEAKTRRKQALALKQQGKTNAEVGDALGVTGERARQMIARAMEEQAAG